MLFIGDSKTTDMAGNRFLNYPVFKSLTGLTYDFQPRFLPEDMQSLDECIDLAFARAKLEASRVIEDYDGFEWEKYKLEDHATYLENKVFLEKYENRLAHILEAEKHRNELDVFGKFKLINYLSMLCEAVVFDYRSFDWASLGKSDKSAYQENYLYYTKYIQRCREISIDIRSKEYLDKLKTHINNIRNYMNDDYLSKPFIQPTLHVEDTYDNKSSSLHNTNLASPQDINELKEELNSMIGLDMVKSRVSALISEIEIKKERELHGLPTSERSYHMVFTGNAGTGKTVVARIIAKMLYALGFTNSAKFVEVTRSELVGEYIGQTAIKTNLVVDGALGGVLFIDEAYALKGDGNDFGKEAITTLLKRMEDERDNLIVIMAGYEDEMEALMDSNQGLRSRLNRKIHFDDYNNNELRDILKLHFNKNTYVLDKLVSEDLLSTIIGIHAENRAKFSNGRGIRNLFEKIVENQELRLYRDGNFRKSHKEALQLIKLEDIASTI